MGRGGKGHGPRVRTTYEVDCRYSCHVDADESGHTGDYSESGRLAASVADKEVQSNQKPSIIAKWYATRSQFRNLA